MPYLYISNRTEKWTYMMTFRKVVFVYHRIVVLICTPLIFSVESNRNITHIEPPEEIRFLWLFGLELCLFAFVLVCSAIKINEVLRSALQIYNAENERHHDYK